MIAQYGFTENQREALETLLENSDILIAFSQSLAISDRTAKGVIDALPDNLSAERKAVIKAACSLVGKVNYFWGGKSSAIGWDSEWGKLRTVTSEGSSSTGTKRPFAPALLPGALSILVLLHRRSDTERGDKLLSVPVSHGAALSLAI